MPSHYLYVCGNGHEEMRYRNAQKCRVCGSDVWRRAGPMPDTATTRAGLLAENARLRERLTLTPERVEAAALAMYKHRIGNPWWWPEQSWEYREQYRADARAALLAAGMREQEPAEEAGVKE